MLDSSSCYSHRVYLLHILLCSISYTRRLSYLPACLSPRGACTVHAVSKSQRASVLCLAGFLWSSHCWPVLQPGRTRRLGLDHCLISTCTPRSQNTTIRLPLPQVLLAVDRSARLSVLPVLGDLLNALCDKRCQLGGKKVSANHPLPNCILIIISLTLKPARSGHTYVRTFL